MNDIHTQLVELFDPELKEELCGLITAEGRLFLVPNVHAEPTKGFQLDPVAFLNLLTTYEIVGTWHTHPQGDAALSQEDYAGFLQWPMLTHYIVGLDGDVRAYEVEADLVLNV
jgi:proteasome lid subunit RPN8/RPN11